jgi:hypothetical protein
MAGQHLKSERLVANVSTQVIRKVNGQSAVRRRMQRDSDQSLEVLLNPVKRKCQPQSSTTKWEYSWLWPSRGNKPGTTATNATSRYDQLPRAPNWLYLNIFTQFINLQGFAQTEYRDQQLCGEIPDGVRSHNAPTPVSVRLQRWAFGEHSIQGSTQHLHVGIIPGITSGGRSDNRLEVKYLGLETRRASEEDGEDE